MTFLFKKEYRLGLILTLVFGLFLFYVDQTSEQVVTYFTGTAFHYTKPAFLKLVYLVLLIVTFAMLSTLNKSEKTSGLEKGEAFNSFVIASVFAFFPGWLIHLYYVVQTIETKASFMLLEDEFWVYHCADLTFVVGFAIAGFIKLRPAIH
ncbi:MAG TPA: hypothetical protein VKY37_00275 [Brumimicrobium sp.]|nr:hypothetical protein [Brumimicrobium sp.]